MQSDKERQYREAYKAYLQAVLAHEKPSRDKHERLREELSSEMSGQQIDAISAEVEEEVGYPTGSHKGQ
jgi:hypothetical protein